VTLQYASRHGTVRARHTRNAALQRTAEHQQRRTDEHHQLVLNHVHGKELH
jgi:hypothetical protein